MLVAVAEADGIWGNPAGNGLYIWHMKLLIHAIYERAISLSFEISSPSIGIWNTSEMTCVHP